MQFDVMARHLTGPACRGPSQDHPCLDVPLGQGSEKASYKIVTGLWP